jgi:microcystin-dependent protein
LPAHAHGLPGGDITSSTGGSQPFDNMQPSLGLNYLVQVEGIFPSQNSGPGSGEAGRFEAESSFIGGASYIGQVALFSGNFEPGWMIADGRLLPISQYTALFSIMGTTYGGDGQTTFALPDLRGRSIVGAGQGPGLGNVSLGQTLGAESQTLTNQQMPVHDHDLAGGGTTDLAGGGQPFSQHQPGLGLNYVVNLQGVFPDRDDPIGEESEAYLGEILAFTGNFAPRGYAFAHGQLLPIAQNQALFALFGTQFGGNGQTTFALPDLRGRVMLGQGEGFAVGDQFGAADGVPPGCVAASTGAGRLRGRPVFMRPVWCWKSGSHAYVPVVSWPGMYARPAPGCHAIACQLCAPSEPGDRRWPVVP